MEADTQELGAIKDMVSDRGAMAPKSVVAALLSFGLEPTTGVAVHAADPEGDKWQVVATVGDEFLIYVSGELEDRDDWDWSSRDGDQEGASVKAECYALNALESVGLADPRVYGGGQSLDLGWIVPTWVLHLRGIPDPVLLSSSGDTADRVAEFCQGLVELLG
jgi:hypothetical protein